MFFKVIKQNSAQKYIAKSLETSAIPSVGKINSLAILVDGTKYKVFPFLKEINQLFGVKPELIDVLYYHSDKKVSDEFSDNMFTDTDLGFNAKFKNQVVTNFIDKPYDGLLCYFNNENVLLNLVAVQSKAKFKIGFSGACEGINNLSISTELDNISEFTFELKKYLSILNKI